MTDLDRPYVINGDDLRILLAVQHRFRIGATFDHGEALGQIKDPAKTAADWLAKNGRLDEMPQPDAARVTVAQLAKALDRDFYATATGPATASGSVWVRLANPSAVAESLLKDITGGSLTAVRKDISGDIVDCEITDDTPFSYDQEIQVIGTVGDALSTLDRTAAGRVIRWLADKFGA